MRVLPANLLTGAVLGITLLGASTAVTVAQPPAAGGKPPEASGPPPGDPMMPDLFIAIRENNIEGVKTLLAKGATTESTNFLGFTPLIWAAINGNEPIATILLDHKANIHVDTIYGGPVEAAEWSGNARMVQLLLDRGATFSKNRTDHITAVMTAAGAGHVGILKLFLAKKPDVNAKDATGMTALMNASSHGQTEAARLLIAAGATVNDADSFGRTPLMYAAQNGYPSAVKLLLSRKAEVNAKDKAGNTALHLAAHYSGNAEVAALLARSGADKAATDSKKRTPLMVAQERGYTSFAAQLKTENITLATLPVADPLPVRARNAATLGLSLIEKAGKNFSGATGCTSCHHQGVGFMATGFAKAYGYATDPELATSEEKNITALNGADLGQLRGMLPHPELYKHVPSMEMGEFNPAISYTFAAMAEHKVPQSEPLGYGAILLASQQDKSGAWTISFHREPFQSSHFTTTAYAIRVIKTYLPEDRAKERDERIAKALNWLIKTPAVTNEDRTFRLLGLKWAGASSGEVARAVAEIRKTQRTDGGWAQFTSPTLAGEGYTRSDAYATGQSLFALNIGGNVPATDAAYKRGTEYLLRTQDDDGSWFVNKRAIPANNYLDMGFPHGESQYVSYTATAWSSMALMIASK